LPEPQRQVPPKRTGIGRIWWAAVYSLHGLKAAWADRGAWRQELVLAMLMLPAACWIGKSWVEVALLWTVVVLVLVAELLNTGIEAAVDRIGHEWHVNAKKAKDVGSAAQFGQWRFGIIFPYPKIIKPKYVFSICVYCGSNPGYLPDYAQAAEQLGAWIGQHNGRLVYGGGRNGLMGVLADATLHSGGQVLGIIPQMLVDKEVAHSDCSELLVVPNMHERKALMMQNADAFLALPGGIGTFEELFEVWTWAQIGYHNKPLGLLN
ncbi:unnamed protein product, partial [Darwinula stevensoni]